MKRIILGGLALVVASTTLWPQHAEAVPAFARKYNFSCTTCHAPFPRLKDYGEDFAGAGFRLPPGEEPARAYRDTGDELLTLQRDLPFAVRFDAFASYESEGDGFADLKTPWGVKLLSGGSVAPNVGYYFYFYLSERGEVAGIEDAYLHFNDIGGHPLDVMVGQFQISDPMLKRELRLSYEDYEVYRYTPGFSNTNLTYDRGVMVLYDTPFGVGLTGQIVNGNGKGEADEARRYDGDKDKGYSLRAATDVGPLSVGLFGYFTKETVVDDMTVEAENEVTIFGPDVHLALGDKASASVQYLRRKDTEAVPGADEVEADAVTAEAIWLPQGPDGRHTVTALWNWIQVVDADDPVYHTFTLSYSWLYRRNLRLIGEVTQDVEAEEARVVAGFTSAF